MSQVYRCNNQFEGSKSGRGAEAIKQVLCFLPNNREKPVFGDGPRRAVSGSRRDMRPDSLRFWVILAII